MIREKAGAPLLSRQAGRVGAVQAGEEKGLGEPFSTFQNLKMTCTGKQEREV